MSTSSLLNGSTGRTLASVRRVLYVYRGGIQDAGGPLELTFDDGTSLFLEAGADGESLGVVAGRWVDPFQHPLSKENQHFVENSGKWTAFKITMKEPFIRAIGKQLDRVDEVRSPSEKVIGARLQLGSVVLRASVDSDELLVDVV